MKMSLGLLLALGLSGSAFATQDGSEVARPSASETTKLRYGWTSETTENAAGDEKKENWVSLRSGHLTGGIDSELKKYRLRLNANGGELLGAQDTEVGKNFLNRFQVEAGAESSKAPYGLLALELPVVKPITFFMGSVHNPGGAQHFILGPIAYYGEKSSSLLFWMPKGAHSDSVVNHTLVLRNRLHDFGNLVWLDVDGSYKFLEKEDAVDGFDQIGYGVALGFWKMYGKYSVAPYYEGLALQKTSYEVGIDASF